MRNICEVNNCESVVVAHGLCDKHRLRLARHGHLKQTRPKDWGKREEHPLYATWAWMRRMESKFSICDEWQDFWRFTESVGKRPSNQHRLIRTDKYGNYSPDNCSWVEVKPNQERAEYAKQWRKDNPDKVKNNLLRKMFGITLEDYNEMYKAQNGRCAICDKHSDDDSQALSVDHCHTTGKVRGLLCNNCNRALGLFNDSPEILSKAIAFLKIKQPRLKTV